ncbi:MAG: DUF1446 domain-containing protein [Acidobacteriota bacterium]|nr:MAG: DUF1446 domain-containing protein [Acidobacteriota bacterium]
MNHETLAIACGAGFGGDRTDVAGPLVETLIASGGPGVLIFETLAERTLALAQLDLSRNPEGGYAPLLEPMVRPVLRRCAENNIPIIGNFGAANPRAAARLVRRLAGEEGVTDLRIAVVEGDDLSDENGRKLLSGYLEPCERELISANVYLGAGPISAALRAGAQIVVTGRVADPSLVVGPALAHFGWNDTDWDLVARATMAGHLLECGAQVTGGYFADPGFKDVPDPHNPGFPIAELSADGSFIITKAASTGGLVTSMTVKEQLLYEVHDPSAYITPDVVADITEAVVEEVGEDRVAVAGIRGHARPDTLKALACYAGGWLGEGEISYAGPNAVKRARLAAEIIRQRIGADLPLRFDLIGALSVFGDDAGRALNEFQLSSSDEIRLRVAGVHERRDRVDRLVREVTALYTCGPAGGGGVRTTITQRLDSVDCYIPRELVTASFSFLD